MDTSNAGGIILIVIAILVAAEALVWLVVWLRYPEYRHLEFHASGASTKPTSPPQEGSTRSLTTQDTSNDTSIDDSKPSRDAAGRLWQVCQNPIKDWCPRREMFERLLDRTGTMNSSGLAIWIDE